MRTMCCVFVLLAFLGPRLVIFLLWILTNYLSRAFDTFLWPLLGFLFLPWTTIAYAIAQNELGGLGGLGLVVVVLGFLADIGGIGGRGRPRGLRTHPASPAPSARAFAFLPSSP